MNCFLQIQPHKMKVNSNADNDSKEFIPAIVDKTISKTRPVSAFLLFDLEYSYKGYKTIKL